MNPPTVTTPTVLKSLGPRKFDAPVHNPIRHWSVFADESLESLDDVVWSESPEQPPTAAAGSRENFSAAAGPDEPVMVLNRILIVDDDAAVRRATSNLLSRAGYHVDCAEDGEAGWAALCQERYDVLITDHNMPRLTGLDLVRRVRANLPNFPVIMISADMPWENADLLHLIQPGFALEKPFSWVDLQEKVRTLLTPSPDTEKICEGEPSFGPGHLSPLRLIEHPTD
jgi:two-component system chemotaxis response regulator CheY